MQIRTVFAINGVTVDLDNELLRDEGGRPISLRRQSFAVLRHLIERDGSLVTKDELTEAVWPGIAVTDDSIVQCVHEIRRALGDDHHLVLKTVPKRGYRFTLPTPIEAELKPPAVPEAMSVPTARRPSAVHLSLTVTALCAILAACAMWWLGANSLRISKTNDGVPTVAIQTEAGSDRAETNNQQAYDALLLGMERLHLDTDGDTRKAIDYFEKAVALDPKYGRAHAAIAAAQLRIVVSDKYGNAGEELDAAHASLRSHLAQAISHPTALAYTVAAEWALQTDRNDEALTLVEKARALAPNDAATLVSKARISSATGQPAEAEAELLLAMRLDPNFAPATLSALAVALFEQGKYWSAIETVGRLKAQQAATSGDYITLISSLGQIGVSEGVDDAVSRYDELALAVGRDRLTVQEAKWRWTGHLLGYHEPYVEQLAEGLRKAGVLEGAGADASLEQSGELIHRTIDGDFSIKSVGELSPRAAGGLFDRGVQFIDVRSAAGYDSGHVPGAANLSVASKLSKAELLKVADPGDQIVFYCGSRYCEDSAIAAAKAVLWGYTRVYRMVGGVPAWKKADCPTEVALR